MNSVPCSFEVAGEETVIAHLGESLDFRTGPAFKEMCLEKMAVGARFFILDFSETRFLDSTALGLIFSLYKQLLGREGRMAFASTSGHVQHAVQITRVYRIFPQYVSVRAARKAFPTRLAS